MANGIVLNIDTTKSEFQNPMVQLRQGDGNYQSLAVTVTSNGEPLDLTGWTVTFMGTTAGGFKIVDSAVTVTNALQGEFTYTPTKAWGQDQGEFKNAYFKFTKSDETASGASFRVNVLDAVDLTAEEAKDYISVVDTLIDDVKTSMDNKLSETKQTLADTQSQANVVQTNVNDLNTSVKNLKTQNINIKATDNTWTGQNTFTQLIDGYTKTQVAPNTDLNLVKKSGKYGIADPASYKNLPTNNTSSYKMLIVEDVLGAGVFYQTLYERRAGFSTADVYFRSFYAGNWLPWTKTSHDDEVMHLTGIETIPGDKTFTGMTTLNNVVSSNVKNASITALGFTVSLAETALGVNVNVVGSGISLLADNTWHILGNMPANITKPKINMYSSMTFAAPAGSTSTNTGFTLRVSFNTTGEIDYKIISLREGDKTNYTVTFDSFLSTTWTK